MTIPSEYVRILPLGVEVEDPTARLNAVDVDARIINVGTDDSEATYIGAPDGWLTDFVGPKEIDPPEFEVVDEISGEGLEYRRTDTYGDFVFVCEDESISVFKVVDSEFILCDRNDSDINESVDCSYHDGFLYVCDNDGPGSLKSFSVSSEGLLTYIDVVECEAEGSLYSVQCGGEYSPFVFAGGGSGLYCIESSPTGMLTQLDFEPGYIGSDAVDVALDEDGYVYVAFGNSSYGRVKSYSVDGSGNITLAYDTGEVGGCQNIEIDRLRDFVFCAGGGGFKIFRLSGSGVLTAPVSWTSESTVRCVIQHEFYTYVGLDGSGLQILYIDEIETPTIDNILSIQTLLSPELRAEWVSKMGDKIITSNPLDEKLHLVELVTDPIVPFKLTFQPWAVDEYDDEMVLYLDTAQGDTSIEVVGEGVAGQKAEVSPSSLTFDNVVSGLRSDPKVLSVMNKGDDPFDLSSIGPPPGFQVNRPSLPLSLPSNLMTSHDGVWGISFEPRVVVACGLYFVAMYDDDLKSFSCDTSGLMELADELTEGSHPGPLSAEYIDGYLFTCRDSWGVRVYSIDQDTGAIAFVSALSFEGMNARQICKDENGIFWICGTGDTIWSAEWEDEELDLIDEYDDWRMGTNQGVAAIGSYLYVATRDYAPEGDGAWFLICYNIDTEGEILSEAGVFEMPNTEPRLTYLKASENGNIVCGGDWFDGRNFKYLVFRGSDVELISIIETHSGNEDKNPYFDIVGNRLFAATGDGYVIEVILNADGTHELVDAVVTSASYVSRSRSVEGVMGTIASFGESLHTVRMITNPAAGRVDADVFFVPVLPKQYSGEIVVQTTTPGSTYLIPVSGGGLPGYAIGDFDLILDHDMRWDQISFLWFNTFGYIQEIKDENMHIPLVIKMQKYVPIGTGLNRPVVGKESIFVTSSTEWRAKT